MRRSSQRLVLAMCAQCLESLIEDFEDVDLSLVCGEAVGVGFDGDAAAMARLFFAPEDAKLFRVSKKGIVTKRAS